MNIHFKQSQFELFPGTTEQFGETKRPRYVLTSFTLSLENIIVLIVCMIMATVLSFSLGVENGKKYVKNLPEKSQPMRQSQENDSTTTYVESQKESIKNKSSEQKNGQGSIKSLTAAAITRNAPNSRLNKNLALNQKISKIGSSQVDQRKSYTVQVGTYREKKFAIEEAGKLKSKGYQPLLFPKGDQIILCVGKFIHVDDAKKIIDKLKGKYKDCLVRRI